MRKLGNRIKSFFANAHVRAAEATLLVAAVAFGGSLEISANFDHAAIASALIAALTQALQYLTNLNGTVGTSIKLERRDRA